MSTFLWGLLSAASLGTADFMGRFSSRAIGATLAYALVLLVGAVGSTAWMLASQTSIVWSPWGWALAIAHGLAVTAMCILLYAGLARGPVAIVAPIVAAHPALVLVINVAMGVRPTPAQWIAMVWIILGGLLIARSAERQPQFSNGGRHELKGTLRIAFGACLAYVLLVLTGQAAVPLIGAAQTI